MRVCERARGEADLRTICPAATSDGHRGVGASVRARTHTQARRYQGGQAYGGRA